MISRLTVRHRATTELPKSYHATMSSSSESIYVASTVVSKEAIQISIKSVVSVTRVWMGPWVSNFHKKKRYVTLEWSQKHLNIPILKFGG